MLSKNKTQQALIVSFFLFLITIWSVPVKADSLITNVHLDDASRVMTTVKEKTSSYTISWTLTELVKASIFICDLDGNIVRTFIEREEKPAAAYSLSWDGRNDKGDLCPTSLYFPIIRAKSKTRGMITYNPTAHPWGEKMAVEAVGYDAGQQLISYSIKKQAFCRVRIDDKNGTILYQSLAGWKLQEPGQHFEEWDGMDVSNVVDLVETGNYTVSIEAYSAPENAIMLTTKTDIPKTDIQYRKYPVHPPHGDSGELYLFQSEGLLPDFPLNVQLQNTKKSTANRYTVDGDVQLIVTSGSGMLSELLTTRELKFFVYVGANMVHEELVRKLPLKYTLDVSKLNKSGNIITVNVKTDNSRGGTASLEVVLAD